MHVKNKPIFFAALCLFICFCLLSASGVVQALFPSIPTAGMVLCEVLAFALPSIILFAVLRHEQVKLKLRLELSRIGLSGLSVAINGGFAIAALSVLLNQFIYRISGSDGIDLSITTVSANHLQMTIPIAILTICVIPAVCEEFFLRGFIFPAFEITAGTMSAIMLSGLCFALLHGNLHNFFGPLFAGSMFAWIAYSFHSIWPAILSHICSNLYYSCMLWVSQTYASYGIWTVFPYINLILFLLFAYLLFRSLEILLENSQIERFRPGEGAVIAQVWSVIGNPVFFVFLLAYCLKAVFKIL